MMINLLISGTVLLASVTSAVSLNKEVRFRVIKRRTSFFNAPGLCSRHGYSIAPFHERVIPSILYTLADAKVSTVWGTGSSLAPGAIVQKNNPDIHDLTVTFVNRRSPLLNERHAVLCVKRRHRSKSAEKRHKRHKRHHERHEKHEKHEKQDSDPKKSSSNSLSTGPSQIVISDDSKASHSNSHSHSHSDSHSDHLERHNRRRSHGHKEGRIPKKKNHQQEKKSVRGKEMIIVNEQKNPRFKVRVDGVQVDLASNLVQKLIQQLGKIPMDQVPAMLKGANNPESNKRRRSTVNFGDAARLIEAKHREGEWTSNSHDERLLLDGWDNPDEQRGDPSTSDHHHRHSTRYLN